jgi:hypothetical protein
MDHSVIRPLLRKELRDQRPFLWIGILLIATELLEILLGQPDRRPLGAVFGSLGDASAGFQVLVAFAVGTGLLMREIEEGTLAFLDGLAVTRAHLFVTKIIVAWAVLMIYPAARILLFAGEHLISRNSLNRALHPQLLIVALALTGLLTFVGLSAGVLLGFLRSLTWVTLGVCAVGIALGQERWPRLTVLNPVALMNVRLVGFGWRVPTESLAVQLGVGAACAVSAAVMFVSTGHRRNLSLETWLKRPLASAVLTATTLGVGIWAFTLYAHESSKDEKDLSESPTAVVLPDEARGHAETRHYTFNYPANHFRQARIVLESGDATFERVESLLHFETGSSIDVDLSGSAPNTEGSAFPDRIRMETFGDDPLATLAHETAHVFALRLAGADHEREIGMMAVFDEGLARWVQLHLRGDGRPPETDAFQAAVVSRRHLVTTRMLTNPDDLDRVNDVNLKYPLGAILVDAFIQRYGDDAPRRLLSALARFDFPRDLQGLELWQAAFQIAGFDLALTFDDYSTRLKSMERQYAAAIDAFPRPRGALVRKGHLVGVEVLLDGPVPRGWQAVVRFRPTETSALSTYVTRRAVQGVAWRSRNDLANEEVCFQTGLMSREATLFEAWECLPLDSASDLK